MHAASEGSQSSRTSRRLEDNKDERNLLGQDPTEEPVDATTEQEKKGFCCSIWKFVNDNPVIAGIVASVVAGVILAVLLPLKKLPDNEDAGTDLPTPVPSLETTLNPNY